MSERIETFTGLISKIGRSIRKIKNREMYAYSLKGPHAFCIYYLFTHGSLTATELSDLCEEDKATISRAIDNLEENGFIIRSERAAKRYKAPIFLTEKGEAVGAHISERVAFVLSEAGEGLSDEERAVFYKALGAISKNLEKIANN